MRNFGAGWGPPRGDGSRRISASGRGPSGGLKSWIPWRGPNGGRDDRSTRADGCPAADALALKPDGVFLSNGPGDPEPCDYAIAATRTIIDRGVPTFGICLGHQIMALASGAKTFKMKFGHHGANHPVKDLDSGRVSITSQNHGFAVDAPLVGTFETPYGDAHVTHVGLNDQVVEGVALVDGPAFSVQYHPEAAAGPHDAAYLFDRFCDLMQTHGSAARENGTA